MEGRRALRLLKKVNLGLESSINAGMAEMDLTAAQCDVLGYLEEHRGKAGYYTGVHGDLGGSRAAVCALIKKLRAKGFVTLTAEPSDDRQKRIEPTGRSGLLHQKMERRVDRVVRQIYRDFTEDEAEAFTGLLQRMYENVQTMIKEEADL